MIFSICDIIKILPHSYPFLLVDRVIESNPGRSIKAIKNVTFNEPFFVGHFPGHPIMPGVLIIESLAQTSAICIILSKKDKKNTIEKKVIYFIAIKDAKFRKPVIPGDTMVMQSSIKNIRLRAYKFHCVAYVEEERVAEATILATLQNK